MQILRVISHVKVKKFMFPRLHMLPSLGTVNGKLFDASTRKVGSKNPLSLFMSRPAGKQAE